jgi:hypothetical protein
VAFDGAYGAVVTIWDDVEVLPGPPPGDRGSEARGVVHDVDGLRLLELSDNGWGALLGWAFGPGAMRRFVDDRLRTVTITCIGPRGRTVEVRPWTRDEYEEHLSDIDRDLAEANIPPRPPGFVWYVALPAALSPGQIWAATTEAQRGSVGFGEWAPRVKAAVAEVIDVARSRRAAPA